MIDVRQTSAYLDRITTGDPIVTETAAAEEKPTKPQLSFEERKKLGAAYLCKTKEKRGRRVIQCTGDPTASGAAKDMCPRCYQTQHRGGTPTPIPLRTSAGDGTRFTIRLSKDVMEKAKAKAGKDKVGTWMRRVIKDAAEAK